MIAPPGYLTREHAERLLAAGDTACAEVLARLQARLAELLPLAVNPAAAQAICARETATALAELAALDALIHERIGAGTEH